MKKIHKYILLSLLVLILSKNSSQGNNKEESDQIVKISIVYDNFDFKQKMESDWGFSCLIEGTDKTILFDTGANKMIFKQNLYALDISENSIDYIVLSHEHRDHLGGLETLLNANSNVTVYMLNDFSKNIKNVALEYKSTVVFEPALKEICKNVYLSGVLGNKIKEQSLAIKTVEGLVIVTGCSHPGIIEIINHFKTELNEEVYMVLGGFHLMRKNKEEMDSIIQEMKDLGVQKCGATHCTGSEQIEQFKEAFGEDYIYMGVGRVIEF